MKSKIVLSFFWQYKCRRSYKLCSYKKKSVCMVYNLASHYNQWNLFFRHRRNLPKTLSHPKEKTLTKNYKFLKTKHHWETFEQLSEKNPSFRSCPHLPHPVSRAGPQQITWCWDEIWSGWKKLYYRMQTRSCCSAVPGQRARWQGHQASDDGKDWSGDLEMIVKFIKANEAGKKADDYLDGGDVMWLEGSCLRAASSFI